MGTEGAGVPSSLAICVERIILGDSICVLLTGNKVDLVLESRVDQSRCWWPLGRSLGEGARRSNVASQTGKGVVITRHRLGSQRMQGSR